MGNILSRIQEIALNEGITIGALERKIGASKGVLSRAINNGTDIQSKWLQIIPPIQLDGLLPAKAPCSTVTKIPKKASGVIRQFRQQKNLLYIRCIRKKMKKIKP